MNRYNELSTDSARAIDQLINALASAPGTGADDVRTATEAVRAVPTYTVTLNAHEVRWLIGHTYYEDGLGRGIWDKMRMLGEDTDHGQLALEAAK